MNDQKLLEEKEKLEQILSRDEYAVHLNPKEPNPIFKWLKNRLEDLLDLFPDVPMPPGTPMVLVYMLLGIVLLVLGVVVIWIVRNMIVRRQGRRLGVFRNDGEMERSSRMQLEEARRAADDGHYEEAIRLMFLALLLMMDEQGWVRAEKWKTNYEYAEELNDRQPAVGESFELAAKLFERVHYGKVIAGRQDYEQIAELTARHWREGIRDV
ncbi:MAG: DUF4129 domain-containing protein [Candidatus Pristimantibacillus sp.]